MYVLPRRPSRFFVCLCALAGFQALAWSAAVSPADAGPRSYGQSVYVPVYSHILYGNRAATFDLAATLSIRNTDPVHSISVTAADYHDSGGRLLKKHIEKPLLLKPLASTEVFVPESDTSGGFGASFIVRWKSENPVVPPVIECLMIGARSGQGISIVSPGRVISESAKQKVFEAYIKDVRTGAFPAAEHTYSMIEGELEKLAALHKKQTKKSKKG